MSKVFIVRFHVIQFTRYSVASRSRGQLLHTSTSFPNCQELFSSFFIFLRCVRIIFAALSDSFDILSDHSPFVKPYLQISSIFFNESTKKEPLSRLLEKATVPVIPRHRSDRSHRRFCGRQQQMYRHCLHHGMQRSCDPADSSAALPPRVSWV